MAILPCTLDYKLETGKVDICFILSGKLPVVSCNGGELKDSSGFGDKVQLFSRSLTG